MSFGGPIDSMINTNRSNLKQLRKRLSLRDLVADYYVPHKELKAIKVSPEVKRQLEEQIAERERKEQRRMQVVIVLTILICIAILYILYRADYSDVIEVID